MHRTSISSNLLKQQQGSVDSSIIVENSHENAFKLYQYRFMNVIVYILGMLQISLMQNSFAPQAAELRVVYNQSNFVYNLTSLIHMFVHVPMSFPANYMVDKYGTKVGNTIACFFCLAACWTRCLVNTSFGFAIFGQLLVGCGNPFMINAISKVSANWYYPSQRATVTGFLSFFSTVTGVVGLLIPGIYFSGYKASEDTSPGYQDGKDKTLHLLLIIAGLVSSISILNLFCYRDKPPTPPSFTASAEREDFKISLKQLIHNKTYILITTCFALVYGCFIDFAVVLGQLIAPFGFESGDTSILSAVSVISGIFGSVCMLNILKKTQAYKKLVGICILGSIASSILMLFVLQTEVFVLILLPSVSLGFFIIPVIPILLELANEVCYPIGEATVTGFIYTLAHISSFILGSIFSLIIDSASEDNKKAGTMYVLFSFCLVFSIAFVGVLFMKQQLNRTAAEQKLVDRQQQSAQLAQGRLENEGEEVQSNTSSIDFSDVAD